MRLEVWPRISSGVQLNLIVDQHTVSFQISNEGIGLSVSHPAMSRWNYVVENGSFVEKFSTERASAFLPHSELQKSGLIGLLKLNPFAHGFDPHNLESSIKTMRLNRKGNGA